MTKKQLEVLKEALSQEDIDVEKLKVLVSTQSTNGNVDPLFQGLLMAMATINFNKENVLIEAHKIRAVANYVPWKYMYASQLWVETIEKNGGAQWLNSLQKS